MQSQRHHHRTQQYSIIALTGPTGVIVERYAYSAYGELTITDGSAIARTATVEGNRYTFTGREWDEVLGQYHFRARVFDPIIGRFGSKDPKRYFDAASQYLFCRSKPTTNLDPLGTYSYTYNDLVHCKIELELHSWGNLAGYDCAADLLDLALDGHPQPGQFYCPASCKNEKLEEAIPDGCIFHHAGIEGGCNTSSQTQIHVSGQHEYLHGDLYYALKQSSWSADLTCSVNCREPKVCYNGCCPCSATCRGNMVVSDTYDFCGSSFGGKFSLTNCGCALQKAGWLTPFTVKCFKKVPPMRRTTVHCSGHDPGVDLADIDCGSTKSGNWY